MLQFSQKVILCLFYSFNSLYSLKNSLYHPDFKDDITKNIMQTLSLKLISFYHRFRHCIIFLYIKRKKLTMVMQLNENKKNRKNLFLEILKLLNAQNENFLTKPGATTFLFFLRAMKLHCGVQGYCLTTLCVTAVVSVVSRFLQDRVDSPIPNQF